MQEQKLEQFVEQWPADPERSELLTTYLDAGASLTRPPLAQACAGTVVKYYATACDIGEREIAKQKEKVATTEAKQGERPTAKQVTRPASQESVSLTSLSSCARAAGRPREGKEEARGVGGGPDAVT